jgi:hypothetical protein
VSSVNSNEFRRQDLTAYTTFDDNTDIDMDMRIQLRWKMRLGLKKQRWLLKKKTRIRL